MADKLSESVWAGFTRKLKLDLDDGALSKALGKLDKADERAPAPRLVALDEVILQIARQGATAARRKKEWGDKAFHEIQDKLRELSGLAEKQRKALQLAVAQAARARQADEEGDEGDAPDLLSEKMIPLLRQMGKGEVGMHALICLAGKNTAVLIMRRPIAPTRRKMLADAIGAKAGAKYITSECRQENKVLTFVVHAQAAGLAKRLREALLAQTGLRLKVAVRGDDGEEHDGEDDAEASPGGAPKTASADQARCEQRLRAMQVPLEQALKAHHPESSKLRAVSGFASEKAAANDFVGAGKALDMLDKLLATPGGLTASAPGAAASPSKPVAAIVFQQARLVWDATRKKARAELLGLQKAILEDFKDEPEFDEVGELTRRLGSWLDRFDERLSDKLDEALNAADAPQRQARQREAALILKDYQAFLATDPGLKLLDANPFTPVSIQKGLLTSLTLLGQRLNA